MSGLPPRPFLMHGRLYLGATKDQEWSICDPTDGATHEAAKAAHYACYCQHPNPQPETVTIERKHLQRLLLIAEGYFFFGTYELGTAVVVDKLKQLRAALRAMGRAA